MVVQVITEYADMSLLGRRMFEVTCHISLNNDGALVSVQPTHQPQSFDSTVYRILSSMTVNDFSERKSSYCRSFLEACYLR